MSTCRRANRSLLHRVTTLSLATRPLSARFPS